MKSAIKTIEAGSLQYALHKHLKRTDLERPAINLHASDITREENEFCPRAAVIKVVEKTPPAVQKVSTSMAVTWNWGRLVEDQVREWFAEMGMAVGDWECMHAPCKQMFRWQKRPVLCRSCGGRLFKYHERRAVSAISGVSCGIDLVLDYGEKLLRPLEVKSIDKEKFADLKMAKSEHRQRTRLYLRCMDESDDPIWQRVNRQRARVLYVSKGGYGTKSADMQNWDFEDSGFSPFKEFIIERDDEEVEYLVQRSLQAKEGFKGGPLPPKLEACKGGLATKRAQECNVNGRCMQLAKAA